MAVSRRKSSGCKRGTFKRKRLGKGYSTVRAVPIGTRPVLKITEPEQKAAAESKE